VRRAGYSGRPGMTATLVLPARRSLCRRRTGIGGGWHRWRLAWAVAGMGGGSPAVGRAAVLPSALPGVAFVPYAGAVPDGGRRGFEAAVAVRAPIV
jgi:hypothetical protein